MLHPICEGKLWGFIDRVGTVIVEPTYAEIRFGVQAPPYPVRVGKKWGFIDERGQLVIEPAYNWVFPFSEGLAPAQKGTKFGYLDPTGAWAIEPQFPYAHHFSSGRATVFVGEEPWFIDPTGTPRFRSRGSGGFVDGLAVLSEESDPNRRGYIDPSGAWVIEPRPWLAFNFHEGLAEVRISAPPAAEWQPPLVGYIDTTGAWVIEPTRFVDAGGSGGPFCEGLARAKTTQAGPIGYIDKTGAWVIEPQFAWAGNFSDGLAMAGPSSMEQGFIDRTGRYVIEARFYLAQDFHDGIACINPDAKRKSALGYIDKTGHWIWQPAKPFAAKFHPR
jgi:WG containing repeat